MSSSISATLSATASASASAVADPNASPASYKVIGVLLAVGSGIFIGGSFVLKKKVSLLVPHPKLGEEKRREEELRNREFGETIGLLMRFSTML